MQYGKSVYGDQAMGQGDMGFDCRLGQEMSLLSKHSWLALGRTQLPIYWVMGVPFPWVNVWGVKLTAYLNLVLKLRMSGALPLCILYSFRG